LLQPLRDSQTIISRLDAVEELVNTAADLDTPSGSSNQEHGNSMSFRIATWLKQSLPRDLDSMCLSIGLNSCQQAAKGGRSNVHTVSLRLSKLVQGIMLLKRVLQVLPILVEALQPAKSSLLVAIRKKAGAPIFGDLLSHIQAVIDPEAQTNKSAFMNRIQCCFAVKVRL
jgi:hypothetical protein